MPPCPVARRPRESPSASTRARGGPSRSRRPGAAGERERGEENNKHKMTAKRKVRCGAVGRKKGQKKKEEEGRMVDESPLPRLCTSSLPRPVIRIDIPRLCFILKMFLPLGNFASWQALRFQSTCARSAGAKPASRSSSGVKAASLSSDAVNPPSSRRVVASSKPANLSCARSAPSARTSPQLKPPRANYER